MATEDKKFPRKVTTTFGQVIEECSPAEYIDLARQGLIEKEVPAEGADFLEAPDPELATVSSTSAAEAAPKKKGA